MKKRIFTGAGIAILTPMHADGSINWEEFGRLIDWQIENSTDAIIVCGTTGESSTMSDEEHLNAIRFAVERAAGRVPVVVTPYYNKTSQRGLIAHYNTIADATDLPMILYHIPGRTGVTIAPQTFKELSRHPNIVAVKEASGNISKIAETKYLCGDDLDLYSGNDDQIVPILSLGGIGVISVLSHVAPKATHDICQLYFDGKVKESARLQLEYMDLVHALFIDVNPIPVKDAMNQMGFAAGPCRMPLYPMSDGDRAVLTAALKNHGLLK